MTHRNRLSAPSKYPIKRKHNTYVADSKGSRQRSSSVPIVVAFRDMLQKVKSTKEMKKALKQGKVSINGRTVSDAHQAVGPMDLVTTPSQNYRMLVYPEVMVLSETESSKTISKIVSKKAEGDAYVYGLHNGENYHSKDNLDTGTTLVRDEGIETVSLEEGETAHTIGGSHAGKSGKIQQISHNGREKDTVTIENDGESFSTTLQNTVAVGDNLQ
jgi:ribosomal protein S4E